MTDDDRRDKDIQRVLDSPLPDHVLAKLAEVIEPHTMNMRLDHGDVMQCIRVAAYVIEANAFRTLADTLEAQFGEQFIYGQWLRNEAIAIEWRADL